MRKCGSSVSLSASCVYTGIVQITFGSEDTHPFFKQINVTMCTHKICKACTSVYTYIYRFCPLDPSIPTQTHTWHTEGPQTIQGDRAATLVFHNKACIPGSHSKCSLLHSW